MSALGFSNATIGVFNALPAVVVLLVGVPVGGLADHFGYRPFILGASLVSALAAALLAVTSLRLLAVGAAGLYALGVTVIGVLSIPMLAQLSRPEERVSLYSVNQSLDWLASVLGYLIGGGLPELASSGLHVRAGSAAALRVAFLAMTLLQAISIPLVFRLTAGPPMRTSAAAPMRLLLRVDWSRFSRLIVPQAFLGIGAGMLLTFIQLYLAQRFHLGPGPIGLALAAGALLTAIVVLAAPHLSHLLGMTRTIGIAPLIGVPLILGLAFVQILPLALGILYLRQLVLNIQAPLYQVFGMEYVDAAERARLATATNVVFNVGFAGLGPLLSGVLQVAGGYQLAFSVSAAFYLLAGASFLWLFRGVRLPSEKSSL